MYPSISSNSNYSPICSSLFNIPSPSMQYEHDLFFEYYYHDHHVLQQPQALADDSTETAINNMADSNKLDALISGNELKEGGGCSKSTFPSKKGKRSNKNTSIPRNKRGYKKDRHSKINTAQGPRDRRIRLSIDIARNFFKLQDMLEFDKASKTVEWLLIKSKSAIMEHVNMSKQSGSNNVKGANSASSVSEGEVVSGIAEYYPSNDHQKKKKNAKKNSCNKEEKKKKKNVKSVRRAAFHPTFTRESRKQAREKARERTELKKNFGEAMAHDILNLRSWSEESGHNGMDHPSHEMRADVEELTSHHEEQLIGTKENIVNDCNLVVTGNWSPYAIFNYQQNVGILPEHQFTDFSFS